MFDFGVEQVLPDAWKKNIVCNLTHALPNAYHAEFQKIRKLRKFSNLSEGRAYFSVSFPKRKL